MKIRVSHYKKSCKELFWNGGTLHIDNDEIVLKNLLKKVAVFKLGYVKYRVLPDEWTFKATEIFDDEKSYIFLFYKRNYLKFLKVLSGFDKDSY